MPLPPSLRFVLAALFIPLLGTGAARAADAPKAGINQIDHIVVIYLENRSFDNLFNGFHGAETIESADKIYSQTDDHGNALSALPPVMNTESKPPLPDTRFPKALPNKPFAIDDYMPLDQKTGDLVHRYYQEQMQIDGGRMDRFALVSDAGGLVMGHYNTKKTALWRYAHDYVLADNFFHAGFGGSFFNHFFLVCACAPRFPKAPQSLLATLDEGGRLVKDGAVTPDYYAVNTLMSSYAPHNPKITDKKLFLPPQESATIGDRLSAKGIGWAWYAGGWNDALAGHPDPLYQFHHQPFSYFKAYGDGTKARAEHLKDEKDFLAAIQSDTLPAVAFFKPLGDENEHPGYADVASGDHKLSQILDALQAMPSWRRSAVIITFDENGGFWDHVPPPRIDRWGPGARVPAIIVSPFAKRRAVDHTLYDTTSILRFIERRYGLEPLGTRDAGANDLTAAFDFGP